MGEIKTCEEYMLTQEINTCEQYVLDRLEKTQCENSALKDEIRCLEEKLAEASKEPEHIAQRVAETGRKLVFERWFYASIYSDAQGFEEFCHDIASYTRPSDISESEAIRFFEPELRELWERTAAEQRMQVERKADKEDAE